MIKVIKFLEIIKLKLYFIQFTQRTQRNFIVINLSLSQRHYHLTLKKVRQNNYYAQFHKSVKLFMLGDN